MSKVLFKRIENSANIDNISIEDGNFIVTGDGRSYIDYGENRVPIAGTPDTTMSGTSSNAVANKTVKNYVDTNIENVNANIHNGFILWTNTNLSSDFTAKNITLNSSDYDILDFVFNYSRNNTTKKFFVRTIKGSGTEIICLINYNEGVSQVTEIPQRIINYVNDTTYSIGDCFRRETNSNSAPIKANGRLIPLCVIGYKTGLFS